MVALSAEPASLWPWLAAQRVLEAGHEPAGAERISTTLSANGAVSIALTSGSAFSLEPVFAPAEWGECTAKIGVDLVVPASSVNELLQVVFRQLEVPEPASTPPPSTDVRFFAGLTIWRAELGSRPAAIGKVELLSDPERPRVRFGLELAFCFGDGSGWLRFIGPRGTQSRRLLVGAFASILAGSTDSA